MPTLSDLAGDWFIARVSIQLDQHDASTLCILELETDAAACKQITIVGTQAIIALRDAIDDEIKAAETRAELLRQSSSS